MKTHPENSLPLAFALAALTLSISAIQPAEAAVWVTNSPLIIARENHTATLLPNGKVLVVGGLGANDLVITSAELYDPATGTWMLTGALNIARENHTATLLPNGKVLVAGGVNWSGYGFISSAELYDPATGTWTMTGGLNTARAFATATLLSDGKVLIAGGFGLIAGGGGWTGYLSSAELYDPATGAWTTTGSLNTLYFGPTATLLPNGKVLVAGGIGTNGFDTTRAELYDPAAGTWTLTGSLNTGRFDHTATLLPNGQVLVAGGNNYYASGALSSVELYDPATGMWIPTGSLNTGRSDQTATLLPDGQVLVAGGLVSGGVTNSVEMYDPVSGTWTMTDSLNTARDYHTATLLANGKVMVTGGNPGGGGDGLPVPPAASTELYNYASGTWTVTGAISRYCYSHTATLLPSGRVLVAGGFGNGLGPPYDTRPLSDAELYNPASGTWTLTGSLNTARCGHTATLLPNGQVLAAGGYAYGALSSAELYDPASGTWTPAGSLNTRRYYHTATLLPNGKVLVAGGDDGAFPLSSAELYDPASGTWTPTGSLNTGRNYYTATLLPSGKVLVAGGYIGYNDDGPYKTSLASAELYDPATGAWTATGAMNTKRDFHTATLLPNGKVLVAGGASNYVYGVLSSAELYDPASGTWTVTGSLNAGRCSHTTTLLPNGQVLVAGGFGSSGVTNSAELYDPASGTWTVYGLLNTARYWHTTTLLPNGQVLVAGGLGSNGVINSAESYDVGLGFTNSWQPQMVTVTSPLNLGGGLVVTGSQFRGISGGSSGNSQDSSADYPLMQLCSIESGQTVFLLTTNWSTNTFTSLPVWNFPPGYALATVFVNGIQSTSSIVNISVPVPTAATLTSPQKLTNGFRFAFTNNVGALFGVLATTNLSLPLTNWTALGGVIEIAPGQFQFTDPQWTNYPVRCYRLRSP
jgi:uncharacterized delta-60 repeat protein